MVRISELFVTRLYRAEFAGGKLGNLISELVAAAREIAKSDRAGQSWSRTNDYPGYTSYASLNDLPHRHPAFAEIVPLLDQHADRFAKSAEFDLGSGGLRLDSLWINILEPGGHHGSHIHPHSVISGTLYLAVPRNASAIKFEDPRLPMLMASPPRKEKAREDNCTFVSVAPEKGTLLLWESWLRHEVPRNNAKSERISLSFNYSWSASQSPKT